MFQLLRLLKIINTFARYRVDKKLTEITGKKGLGLLFWLIPGRWLAFGGTDPNQSLRLALQELGPVFIKFGQMLSTRRDILEDELADDLSQLQDNIPPFSSELARDIIEKEIGRSITEVFQHFDNIPLAAASVAQVHTAQLHSGEAVVVKVIRPGLAKLIRQDIKLMQLGAKWLQRLLPITRRFYPDEVIRDYENTIMAELDCRREAANQQRFRNNFENSNLLYVPEVHWDFVRTSVLVMERVYGVPIDQIDELKRLGVNLEKLSERGVRIFFMQVFRDNFFHADMHPGNVMVSVTDPENPSYISLDNAIVGSLDRNEQFLMARILMAFLDRDYEQMAKLLMKAGWVPEDNRLPEFEIALQAICEPVFDKPLDELEFGPLLVSLFSTARQFKIHALPQFVLLEKTLLHIEGLGRSINPKLDIWGIGRPLLNNWMKQKAGPEAITREIKRNVPAWAEQLPMLPQMAYDALDSIANQKRIEEQILAQISQQNRLLERGQRRSRDTILGLILLAVAFGIATNSRDLVDFTNLSWVSGLFALSGGLFVLKALLVR